MNPNNERLNKKVRREAQLFAKLNHEHVVRYFSAWIENVSLETTVNSSNITSPLPLKDFSSLDNPFNNVPKKKLSDEWDPSFRNISSTLKSSSSDSDSKGKGLWKKIKKG